MISIEEYSEDLRQFIVMHREHEASVEVREAVEKDPDYALKIPTLLNAWRGAYITWFEFEEDQPISVLWFPQGATLLGSPEFEIYSFKSGEVVDRVETIQEVEVILNKFRKAANL